MAEYSHEGGAIRKRRTFIPTWGLGNFDTIYSYDQYGRMTGIAQSFSTVAGSTNADVEFIYDTASNLVGEKYKKQGDALAEGDRFAYDEHHRLAKAWLNSQSMTADPDTVAFKQRLTYGMDRANNRTQLAEKLGQAASETAVAYVVDGGVQGGTPPNPSNRYASVGGFSLGYDSRGNTRRTKSSPTDEDLLLTYDGLGRVSEVHVSVASSSSSAMSMSSSWGGELEGGELFGGGMGLETGSEVPMTAEGLNAMEAARSAMMARIGSDQVALLQRAMDPTLLEEAVEPIVMTPGPGAGAMSMSSMQSSSEPVLELRAIYVYDAFNRRVARFVPGLSYFSYTWDGWQEAEEYRNLVVGSQYVWGEQLDELVAYRHKADTANGAWANYYVAEGGAHCPSRILNSSGQVVEIQEYDPYGKTSLFDGSGSSILISGVGNPFGWKGHRVDGETGLVYMRNRYYHTGWGRFLTQDPMGAWWDLYSYGNAYCYVGCSPTVRVDPYGLQTIVWHHRIPQDEKLRDYRIEAGITDDMLHSADNGWMLGGEDSKTMHGVVDGQDGSSYNQQFREQLEQRKAAKGKVTIKDFEEIRDGLESASPERIAAKARGVPAKHSYRVWEKIRKQMIEEALERLKKKARRVLFKLFWRGMKLGAKKFTKGAIACACPPVGVALECASAADDAMDAYEMGEMAYEWWNSDFEAMLLEEYKSGRMESDADAPGGGIPYAPAWIQWWFR